MSSGRRPWKSLSFPTIDVAHVDVSRYAATTQKIREKSPMSRTIWGNALAMMVWSSADRNNATRVPMMTARTSDGVRLEPVTAFARLGVVVADLGIRIHVPREIFSRGGGQAGQQEGIEGNRYVVGEVIDAQSRIVAAPINGQPNPRKLVRDDPLLNLGQVSRFRHEVP
jgi:hypothetical protein